MSSRPRAERARDVAAVLRRRVLTGAYGSGPLPDEQVLGAELSASRNSVREALRLLRDEGLITRRQGVGTLVATPRYGHGLDRLAGLAESLGEYGTVSNQVLAAHAVAAPPAAIAEQLALRPGEGAVYIERLRWLGGEPLSIDRTHLVPDIGARILGEDLAGRDLFALIEATAGPLGTAEMAVHAVAADPDTAALLRVAPGAPLFAIARCTTLAGGRPVDAESIHIRGDRLTLRSTLHRVPAAGR